MTQFEIPVEEKFFWLQDRSWSGQDVLLSRRTDGDSLSIGYIKQSLTLYNLNKGLKIYN